MTLDRFLEVEVDRVVGVRENDRPSGGGHGPCRRIPAGDSRHLTPRRRRHRSWWSFPTRYKSTPSSRRRLFVRPATATTELDFDLPNRAIAAELAADGIPMLDLLPIIQRQGRATRLYKPQDTHWNIAGNRLAAESIAAFLRDRLRLRVCRDYHHFGKDREDPDAVMVSRVPTLMGLRIVRRWPGRNVYVARLVQFSRRDDTRICRDRRCRDPRHRLRREGAIGRPAGRAEAAGKSQLCAAGRRDSSRWTA